MPQKREVAPELVEEWERMLSKRGTTLHMLASAAGYSRSFVGRSVQKLKAARAAAMPQAAPVGRNPTLIMPGNLARLIAEEAGSDCR